MKIFSGNSNQELALGICGYLDVPPGKVEVSAFPNGEIRIQLQENVEGCDVFVIQSLHHPVNHHIMELLIMVDALRRAAAARITAVIPYFGYARQDRQTQFRTPITAKLIANLLVTAGVNHILTLDLHTPQITGFFDIPVDHLSGISMMIDHIQILDIRNMTICSPDAGGMKMATLFADCLNLPFAAIRKRRLDATHVEAVDVMGNVEGQHILLVDDIMETGETLITAAKLLKTRGARSIKVVVMHGILTASGQEKIKNSAIDLLITTNSTPTRFSPHLPVQKIDISPLFGQAIQRIHGSLKNSN
jgi:ribose-phosphate pyrophosphokinase